MLQQMSEDEALPGEQQLTTGPEFTRCLLDYERWFSNEIEVLNKKVLTTHNPDWIEDAAVVYLRQASIFKEQGQILIKLAEEAKREKQR